MCQQLFTAEAYLNSLATLHGPLRCGAGAAWRHAAMALCLKCVARCWMACSQTFLCRLEPTQLGSRRFEWDLEQHT